MGVEKLGKLYLYFRLHSALLEMVNIWFEPDLMSNLFLHGIFNASGTVPVESKAGLCEVWSLGTPTPLPEMQRGAMVPAGNAGRPNKPISHQ
jgi:hypothetical protein